MTRLAIRPLTGALLSLAACRTRALDARPASERPLLSYLSIGSKRLAFAGDTVFDAGRRTILVAATFDGASRIVGPSAVGNKVHDSASKAATAPGS